MSDSQKNLADLMNELSTALTDLSDKMSNLTLALENNLLISDDSVTGSTAPSAHAIIEKVKSASHRQP